MPVFGYRVYRLIFLVFWYRQRLVQNILCDLLSLIFLEKKLTIMLMVQCGLSAIAELRVPYIERKQFQ